MERRTIFGQRWLPMALIAPQFLLTLVFFFWPACQAIWSSLTRQDPFGSVTEQDSRDSRVSVRTDHEQVNFVRRDVVRNGGIRRSVEIFDLHAVHQRAKVGQMEVVSQFFVGFLSKPHFRSGELFLRHTGGCQQNRDRCQQR